jgi:hypothetical protein
MSTPISYALVSLATGRVQTFVRPDLPAGWTPPEGYSLVAREELPQGWQMEPVSAEPLHIDSDTVLQRLTSAEREALFSARRTVWQVDYFLTRASSTGVISTADADLPAAQAMLAQLGIVAANRWPALLAP